MCVDAPNVLKVIVIIGVDYPIEMLAHGLDYSPCLAAGKSMTF